MGLAGSAAQMSYEHEPARAADRDGNDGQRDGEGRAGRQTLPEHGVGGGPHERADRDRARGAGRAPRDHALQHPRARGP